MGDEAVFNAEAERARNSVADLDSLVRPCGEMMVGNGLSQAISSTDAIWHDEVVDANGNVVQEGTVDRIMNNFRQTVADLRNTGVLPPAVVDGLNQLDTTSIEQNLRSQLDALGYHEGNDFHMSLPHSDLVDNAVSQIWKDAWQSVFETSVTSFGFSSLDDVIASNAFSNQGSENTRVDKLVAAMIKASYAGE